MISRVFIERPIFAWVLAIVVMLGGAFAIRSLPISQYPNVAPPNVSIRANYPGASAETIENSVTQVIEQTLTGIDGMLYFSSTSTSRGQVTISVTFDTSVDPDIAQVQVQNQVQQAIARLPQQVQQQGIVVRKANPDDLMLVAIYDENNLVTNRDIADYLTTNFQDPISRIAGIGDANVYGSPYAMRVWLDPSKLASFQLMPSDVVAAIRSQNAEVAAGQIGDQPQPATQMLNALVTAQTRLQTADQFRQIVLKTQSNGASVRLQDVARVEIGSENYNSSSLLNGHPAAGMALQLAPGANALESAELVRAEVARLAANLPQGWKVAYLNDATDFIKLSISEVVKTLIEAIVLVVIVMFVFLQSWRATLIPAIAVPVVLLGTFGIIYAAGFSINTLTLFGLVLAIGLLVDDAIVVVENVERLMAEEGLGPREATIKAMKEITGAVIGITLVLTAVFLPMAFSSGSVGVIYKQFTLSMAVSILFSAFLALSLTPALCATLLKPIPAGHHEKRGFFGWFNRRFDRLTRRYESGVGKLVARSGRMMLVFVALSAALVGALRMLPSSFLPEEDQGYFMTMFQLPPDATIERTMDSIHAYDRHLATRPGIGSNMSVVGYGFSGNGPNAAMAFTMMKPWKDRGGATTADEAARAQAAMAGTEGMSMSLMPPAIEELGNSYGFTMRLVDQANQGVEALQAAQARLLALASQSTLVAGVYPDGLPPGRSVKLSIDRQKAQALGIEFNDISDTISTAMGSQYVNDFPNRGRMQQVIVQADASARMQLEDLLKLTVRNSAGGLVRLSEVVTPEWRETPLQLVRYQGYLAARISGSANYPASSGEAMAEMERLVAQLPPGFAVAWTGQSLQERESAAEAPMLLALSMLVVFLVLAALYESWSIPVSVMLVVPLGLIGAVAAVFLRGLPNDVFFKVGMITVIGLSAKNAILIVEFAKQLREEGKGLVEAVVTAARLRLRPILMTSLAFVLGVVPLVVASGASAETQHAIGTGVLGGMLSATVLAILFVPVFFVFVMSLTERAAAWRGRRAGATGRETSHNAQEHA